MMPLTKDKLLALSSLAHDQGGYFTTKQALAIGYGYRHLEYHETVGNFKRISHGLYRLLMIEHGPLKVDETHQALNTTFSTRGTHPLPVNLPLPPESWSNDFPKMAVEAGLPTTDFMIAYDILSAFWQNNRLGENANHNHLT